MVFWFPETSTLIPWTILSAVYSVEQFAGGRGYNGKLSQIHIVGFSDINELNTGQVGRTPLISSSLGISPMVDQGCGNHFAQCKQFHHQSLKIYRPRLTVSKFSRFWWRHFFNFLALWLSGKCCCKPQLSNFWLITFAVELNSLFTPGLLFWNSQLSIAKWTGMPGTIFGGTYTPFLGWNCVCYWIYYL